MKNAFYLYLLFFVFISCSIDDRDKVLITVDIQEGILGQWYVETSCNYGRDKFEFLEENILKYYDGEDVVNGTYTVSGRDLVINRHYEILQEPNVIRDEYIIMVLTENRLELDNIADWNIDYRMVRECE